MVLIQLGAIVVAVTLVIEVLRLRFAKTNKVSDIVLTIISTL